MHLVSWFSHMLDGLVGCRHGRAPVVEGKTYCPDCGQGVVFRWVVLRCSLCHQRRPAGYRYGRPVPSDRCCTYCGDMGVYTQVLDDPQYFQLRYAILRYETDGPPMLTSLGSSVAACLAALDAWLQPSATCSASDYRLTA